MLALDYSNVDRFIFKMSVASLLAQGSCLQMTPGYQPQWTVEGPYPWSSSDRTAVPLRQKTPGEPAYKILFSSLDFSVKQMDTKLKELVQIKNSKHPKIAYLLNKHMSYINFIFLTKAICCKWLTQIVLNWSSHSPHADVSIPTISNPLPSPLSPTPRVFVQLPLQLIPTLYLHSSLWEPIPQFSNPCSGISYWIYQLPFTTDALHFYKAPPCLTCTGHPSHWSYKSAHMH